MRRFAAVVLILAACSSSAPPPKPASGDDFEIESTILATYNVISGPAGRRDWDRFKELFAPGARLISMKDGKTNVMTPDEYQAKAKPYFDEHGFFERPASNKIERYKEIAHVYSAYESRHASNDEQPFARGVNSFQLVKIDGRWMVQTILWEE
jgi:hypothetical protein